MQVLSQEFVEKPLADLKPHPENPRKADLHKIEESIQESGWYGAIIAQKSTGFILAGNHRYLVALKNGADSIPVCLVDCSDEVARKILVADNAVSDAAGYDEPGLTALLQEIASNDGSVRGTGFDDKDLDRMLRDTSKERVPMTPAADETSRIAPAYQVIVEFTSEELQAEFLEELGQRGIDCRALVV